jgi:hypothetical protein
MSNKRFLVDSIKLIIEAEKHYDLFVHCSKIELERKSERKELNSNNNNNSCSNVGNFYFNSQLFDNVLLIVANRLYHSRYIVLDDHYGFLWCYVTQIDLSINRRRHKWHC